LKNFSLQLLKMLPLFVSAGAVQLRRQLLLASFNTTLKRR
jgi:hypothetical protein